MIAVNMAAAAVVVTTITSINQGTKREAEKASRF